MYGAAFYATDMIQRACVETVLLAGVWSDLKTQKIHNSMILAGCAIGMVLAIQAARPPDVVKGGILEWSKHFIGAIAILYIFFLTRALGAGDIKLYAVLAGMMPMEQFWHMLIASLLLGALSGIPYLFEDIRQYRTDYGLIDLPAGLKNIIQRNTSTKGSIKGNSGKTGQVHFSVWIAAGYFVTQMMGNSK